MLRFTTLGPLIARPSRLIGLLGLLGFAGACGSDTADRGSQDESVRPDAGSDSDGGGADGSSSDDDVNVVNVDAATCEAASASREECSAHEGCEYVPASARATMTDGGCEQPSSGICVLMPNGATNNGVITCFFRETADGYQSFHLGANANVVGWSSDIDSDPRPKVCSCHGF